MIIRKIKDGRQFGSLRRLGVLHKNPFFDSYVLKSSTPRVWEFGVLTSKKFDKRAVMRNRARRLITEALRLTAKESTSQQGYSLLFIPHEPIKTTEISQMREAMESVFDTVEKA